MATEKEIKDYLHLYFGQEVLIQWSNEKARRHGDKITLEGDFYNSWMWDLSNTQLHNHKLLLRPLSDMTEKEAVVIAKMGDELIQYSLMDIEIIRDSKMIQVVWHDSEKGEMRFMIYLSGKFITAQNPVYNYQYITSYLLKQGFDIFGLIEAGLAIDKTKIN